MIVDPEGGAHDVRRFSTRQDAASKNPGHVADGRFASALGVFFGYFLCDKESDPRKARKLCSCFFDGYRYAQPILPCCRIHEQSSLGLFFMPPDSKTSSDRSIASDLCHMWKRLHAPIAKGKDPTKEQNQRLGES